MSDIILKIEGSQQDEYGEENKIELVVRGKRYTKNGVDYIIYEENGLSGLEDVKTFLKVHKDRGYTYEDRKA